MSTGQTKSAGVNWWVLSGVLLLLIAVGGAIQGNDNFAGILLFGILGIALAGWGLARGDRA